MRYAVQPILFVAAGTAYDSEATYDDKFENFFAFVCRKLEWDVQQAVFFWVREEHPVMKIDGNKTPRDLDMKRYEEVEVHAFARHDLVPRALLPKPDWLLDWSDDEEVY